MWYVYLKKTTEGNQISVVFDSKLDLPIKRKQKKKSPKNTKNMFSKCLLRHDVVRVFVASLVLVFVRAILSWCP